MPNLKFIIFLSFAILFCAFANPAVKHVDGEYHVYPGSNNKGFTFNTIQEAIDAAVDDGWGTIEKPGAVIVHESDSAYKGDKNDEIRLPLPLKLISSTGSTAVVMSPVINATVIVTNINVQDFLFPVTTGTIQGFRFFCPPEKPCVVYNDNGLNNGLLTLTFCTISKYDEGTAVVAVGGTVVIHHNRFYIPIGMCLTTQDCLHVHLEFNTFFTKKIFKMSSPNVPLLGGGHFIRNQIDDPFPFLADDVEMDFFNFESSGHNFEISYNSVLADAINGSIKDVRFLTIHPDSKNLDLKVTHNMILIGKQGGVNLLYDVPNDPSVVIRTGANTISSQPVFVSDVTAGNYDILIEI